MKKVNTIVIPAILLVLCFALIGFSGCKTEENTVISYTVIAQNNLYGAGREGFVRQNIVIRDNAAWQNLINQINAVNNTSETFTETNINFSEYMIVAVFDEVKGNGGWSIDITNIENQENQIVVNLTNLKTGNAASVITQPYQIVKIPVSNKEIIFETFYKNIGE
jgi:hypothetical protein